MLALFLYGVGLASLFLSDLLVAAYFSAAAISDWAEVRSLIGLSGILCLVGLDSMLMRSPQYAGRILKILFVQIPIIALVVALLIRSFGYLSSYMEAWLLAIGSAWTIGFYQYFRTNLMPTMAQFSQQFWRIGVLLFAVVFLIRPFSIAIGNIVIALLLLGVMCSAVVMLWRLPRRFSSERLESFGSIYRIGFRFMVTSIFLALAVYAEQLLVIKVGTTSEAALYFTHATFFLFPIGIINGYAGFVLGPWVRDNHDKFVAILTHRYHWLVVGVFLVSCTMSAVGVLGWWLLSPGVGEPDWRLVVFFSLCGAVITLYQLPSAYNGIFASAKHHDALIAAQITSLFMAGVVFWITYYKIGMQVTISVAAASLTNWCLRTAFGFFVGAAIVRTR